MEFINKPSYQKGEHMFNTETPKKFYVGKCICGGIIYSINSVETCSSCPHPKKEFINK